MDERWSGAIICWFATFSYVTVTLILMGNGFSGSALIFAWPIATCAEGAVIFTLNALDKKRTE